MNGKKHPPLLPAAVIESQAVRNRSRRFERGLRALLAGIVINLAFIVLKAVVGTLGHSDALVADAVHSGADLVNSSLAFVSLLISRRPADATHPYGHGRAEALAASVAATIIFCAGLLVGWDAINGIRRGHSGQPDVATLVVAVITIVVKLGLAVYATRVARAIHSKAVGADARDHVTDILSATVVVIGISAARLGVSALDPFAGLLVSGFILYTAVEIFRSAADELMDTSLPPLLRAAVIAELSQVSGMRLSGLAGRTIGDVTIVEIHGDVDPDMTAGDAGRIVDQVKGRLIANVADVDHVVVELNSGVFEPDSLRVEVPPS